jgi:glycosyltransferase involved in cell wall biosynthesis
MKVLILNTLYHPFQVGGAERSTQLLAEALAEAGHDVVVACTKPEAGTVEESVNGVRVYYLDLKNVYWQLSEETKKSWLKPVWHALDSYNPLMQRDVAAIVREEAPDLVHTHNLGGFSVSAWRAAQKADTPIVHTLRDYSLLCPRNMFRNGENCTSQCMQCRPFAAPRRWLSQQVTAVVGISRFILNRHRAHGYFEDADHQTVIHNPFPLPEEVGDEPGREKQASGGKTPGVPSSEREKAPLRVGFLGRLTDMKGIDQLLRVVDSFRDGSIELHVGGTGRDRYVESLTNTYDANHVTFCGFVDPSAFLPNLDVLVVPSRWHEPFGRVVIEAYAHGVPVVAARSGGLPEIVDDGETGWTFDPDDDDTLRERIAMMRDRPERLAEMRLQAREKARSFGVDRHADAYVDVYEHALESSNAPSRRRAAST